MANQKGKWLRWCMELLVVVVIVVGIQSWRGRDMVTGSAPPLSGNTIDGEFFDLASAPKPLLVHFWGTWCPICRAEEGSIQNLSEAGQVITVAMSSGDDSEILDYLTERKLDFPVINDVDGSIASAWGISGVPASFVIDNSDQVKFSALGYTTGLGLRVRLWIAED